MFYATEPVQFARAMTKALIPNYYKRFEAAQPSIDSREADLIQNRLGKHISLWRPLYQLVRATKPKICIETGTGLGGSATSILWALEMNQVGHLHSIELIAEGAGRLIPHNLRHRFTQHIGDSKRVLPNLLRSLGRVDFFLHDGNHRAANMKFEFESVWDFLGEGSILASDDVTSNDTFGTFATSKKCSQKMVKSFGYIIKPRLAPQDRRSMQNSPTH